MPAGRRLLFTLALTLAAGVVPASRLSADALSDARARLAAERDRIEEKVRTDRVEANRLATASPPRKVDAIELLETLVILVQGNKALTPERRSQLVVTLRADIRRVESATPGRRPPSYTPPPRLGGDYGRPDDRRIKEGKDRIGGIGSDFDRRKKAIADSRNLQIRTNDGIARLNIEVQRSSIPDGRPIVFPPDYAKRMVARGPAQPLTKRESDTLRAMQQVIPADFRDSSFEAVVDYLQTKTGINILIDKQALMEVGVSYSESKLNLKLKATTRTILRRVLADLGLGYTIKNGDIQVTSLARARDEVTTRTYYVGDLAVVTGVPMNSALGQFAMIQNLQRIVTLIKQTVDPQSWRDNNPEARGTITLNPVTMQIIITQSAEVHYSLGARR